MTTIIWIVVAVVAVGLIIYFFRGKIFKKKEGGPPTSPPATPAPPAPPENPAM